MLKKLSAICFCAIACLVCAMPMAQAEPTIDDITLGQQWMGDPITVKDLANHVVAIEFTGMH